MSLTIQEFAARIKSKYPEYAGIDDTTLTNKMIEKYPEYKSQVNVQDQQPQQQQGFKSTLDAQIEENAKKSAGVYGELFPRTLNAQVEGKSGLQQGVGAALDVYSLPGRVISSLFRDENETFGEALSRLGKKEDAGAVGGFIDEMVRDPATLLTAPIGGVGGGVGKQLLKQGVKQGIKQLAKTGLKQGLKEGVVSAGTHQAENFSDTGNINLGEGVGEIALSGTMGIAGESAGKALSKFAKSINKNVGKIAEWATGVDEKALRMGGSKTGRAKLQESFGKQVEIGQDLVDMIDNAYDYIPEKKIIDESLENMPGIDVVPIIKKLENKAGQPMTKEMKDASQKILDKANELRQITQEYGDSGIIPAKTLVDYRKEIDVLLQDEFGKSSGKYLNALKDMRHDIKTALIDVSKGTEYEKTMKDFANKIDTIEKMKKLLGKTSETRELRAEGFIRNINNAGKSKAKEWLGDFEKVFGKDFVEKSEMTRWAEMFGDEGKGAWLPRWTTGRSLWAKGAGVVVGSPKIASRVTLPTTQAIEKGGEAIEKALKTKRGKTAGKAIRSSIRSGAFGNIKTSKDEDE